MPEQIRVNGVDLDRLVSNVGSLAGLLRAPPRRGTGTVVPGRHGVLRPATRAFGPGRLTLPMWVAGADAVTGDNLAGDPAVTAFYALVDELVGLFHAPMVTITHELPAGETRRAVGDLVDEPMDFTRQLGSPLFGQVSVELELPDPFWFDPAEVTASGTVATGGFVDLAPFAGSTGPVADGVVTFGPGSNPTLIQGGAFVAYDGIIAAGRQLTVDCGDWSLGTGSGTVWTPNVALLRYGPGPSWFELDPTGPGQAVLTHTGGGSMFVSFTGRRRYLTG